jgi:hypothetical protein
MKENNCFLLNTLVKTIIFEKMKKQQCFYDSALYAYTHTYADGWDEKSKYHTINECALPSLNTIIGK